MGDIPLVSVVIPTHNRPRLLERALDSIGAQEGLGKEFELQALVVDDASTDDTPAVVSRYPWVRGIRLSENRGVSAARNAGIAAATGQYVAFLDDDDIWLPWKLRYQVRALEAAPEAGVVYSQQIMRSNEELGIWPEEDACPSGWVVRPLLRRHFPTTCTVLIRREALEEVGPFDESFDCWEEFDLWVRLAFHCRYKFVPGPVAVYQVAASGRFLSAVATGTSAGDLRRITEGALERLEGRAGSRSDFADEVRVRNMLAVAWQLQNLEQDKALRAYLLGELRVSPWMARHTPVRSFVAEAVGLGALASPAPLALGEDFCGELRALTLGHGLVSWFGVRRLQAQVWRKIAVNLASADAPRARLARYAALRAVLTYPAVLGRGLLRILVGSIPNFAR